jgi:hypothetical protein
MKVAYWFAAVLALTVGISFAAADPASAWCGWRCRGAVAVMPSAIVMPAPMIVSPAPPAIVVSVPAPNPMPLRAPCGGACGGGGAVGYAYAPVVYGYYAATPACYAGSSCYFRRNCWYDAFGRRFCN